MVGIRSRLMLLAAGVTVGVAGIGVGPAAARPAKIVLSDSVKFSANYVYTSSSSATFSSTSCTLTSDGETKPYKCQITGEWHYTSTGALNGSAKMVSGDGTTKWTFVLIVASSSQAKMNGSGVEADAPEGGKPSPQYKCTLTGQWTAVSGVLSGNIAVLEPSTSP
jgi:hypothetical protein